MITLKDYIPEWTSDLKEIYEERESKNMLLLALEDVLGWSGASFLTDSNKLLSEEDVAKLEDLVLELQTGNPYQYCVGFTYFCDLKIDVSPAVLIPRPETEELVEWVKEALPADFSGRIEDWCTGSGCIALALKQHFPKASVYGIDISIDAIHRAKSNGEKLNLDVHFEIHSALSDEDVYTEPLDVLVSNPPYIPVDEREKMNRNVRDFEPEVALFVPSDEALLFYDALGSQAQRRLKPGGLLFFELHEDYAHETKEAMIALGFKNVQVRRDLQNKPRMLMATK
jgi:release factor glutamine methyltransferase